MRLFKMKTRQMVDKSFSQHMIYQVFRAITHDIFNDKTWFPTSRCSCEDVFYEVFCIVDKMMFSHTDTESRLAFVEGIGQYEKNYVDEDEYATAQEERQRIVFVILYMAAVILQMMPLESKVFQFCSMIMGQWRGYVTQEFSQRCLGAVVKNRDVVERLAANIGYYGEDGFFVSPSSFTKSHLYELVPRRSMISSKLYFIFVFYLCCFFYLYRIIRLFI